MYPLPSLLVRRKTFIVLWVDHCIYYHALPKLYPENYWTFWYVYMNEKNNESMDERDNGGTPC